MLVRHFMSRLVQVLPGDMACSDAWSLFVEQGLRRAPVVDNKRVLGMITDRDLLRVLPWNLRQLEGERDERDMDRPVRQLLSRDLVSVAPSDHLETAAALMLRHKIGGLPVIDGGELLGIITESDLFRTFVNLKAHSKGTRLTLHWPKELGECPDPARIAVATGTQLHEYLEHPSPGDGLVIGLRIAGKDVDGFVERMLDAGYQLLDREDPQRS